MKNENSNFYRRTEQRLFAYKDLKAKINNDILDLRDLKKEGITARSKDILYRGVKGGIRLSPEELQQIKMDCVKVQIQESARELSRLDDALDAVGGDYYTAAVKMRYFDRETDEYIAEKLSCDVSTVRRNRKRIVNRMAVRLYGVVAIS